MRVVSGTAAIGRHCDKCGEVFTAARRSRTSCVQCKAVGRKELKALLNFDGPHVVIVKEGYEAMLS